MSKDNAQFFLNISLRLINLITQKILAEGFISFSVVAIANIFVGGGLIILPSFTLNSILSWPLDHMGRTRYPKLEWATNEILQLQRLAHEASGTGTWSRGTGPIPVTRPGDLLAVLDIADPTHPKLRAMSVNRDTRVDQLSDGTLDSDGKTRGGSDSPSEVKDEVVVGESELGTAQP